MADDIFYNVRRMKNLRGHDLTTRSCGARTHRTSHRQVPCLPYGYTPNDSPFVYPVVVDVDAITCIKRQFAEAVLAEGIGSTSWRKGQPYLADSFDTPNAQSIRDQSFCLYSQ
jgi:hypothetical protein